MWLLVLGDFVFGLRQFAILSKTVHGQVTISLSNVYNSYLGIRVCSECGCFFVAIYPGKKKTRHTIDSMNS